MTDELVSAVSSEQIIVEIKNNSRTAISAKVGFHVSAEEVLMASNQVQLKNGMKKRRLQ